MSARSTTSRFSATSACVGVPASARTQSAAGPWRSLTARQWQEHPEERKQDRDDRENNNHERRVKGNRPENFHVNSPVRPTLPCKFKKRNGTLDITAAAVRRNAVVTRRSCGTWVHLAARSAMRRGLSGEEPRFGRTRLQNIPGPYGWENSGRGRLLDFAHRRASDARSGNRATVPPPTRLRALSAPRLAILGGVAPKHFHPRLIWEENGPAVT